MADSLSISASVVGLVSLGIQVFEVSIISIALGKMLSLRLQRSVIRSKILDFSVSQ